MSAKRTLLLLIVVIMTLLASSAYAVKQQPPSLPEAMAWLKKMNDYMNTLTKFQVHFATDREVVFPKGGKLDINAYGDIYVQRPNMLRVKLFAPNRIREIFYDGKTLSVFTPKLNYYGTIPAPPTTAEMLRTAMDEYGISIPLADILRPNLYATVAPRIDTGIVAGPSLINGVYCKHLAFRSGTMVWQVWIENSQTPLLRRVVIVDNAVKGSPRYMVTLTRWNISPTFDDTTFTFTPPAGAQKIEFVKPGKTAVPAAPRKKR